MLQGQQLISLLFASYYLQSPTQRVPGDGQGAGVPQVRSPTGGCGLARVLSLRVCKRLGTGVAYAGEEGRINVLPWYRPVGVVRTSSEA